MLTGYPSPSITKANRNPAPVKTVVAYRLRWAAVFRVVGARNCAHSQ
jgi:hypothetical protein